MPGIDRPTDSPFDGPFEANQVEDRAQGTHPATPHTPQYPRKEHRGQRQDQERHRAPQDPSAKGLDQKQGEDNQKHHLDGLAKYYALLAQMPPDITLNQEVLLKLFDRAFGKDRAAMTLEWRAYMRSLKTDFERAIESAR